MKQIVKQRFHGTENDRDLIEAEIQIDELEELPEPDEFESKRLIMGSQCWVIGTGDLYGLTSTGDWVKVNFMGNGEGGGGGSAYAHSLELTIDSQTYVMTATLKNTSGEALGTPQTIDLPLETMVVGGSYDDTTKKVILTLKNGNTVDFSVADLVSGLQTEITSTNKLNSDLVDDTNQNNKFVTSAEKTKIANALTEETYNAGKTVAKGTTVDIDGITYTVGDYAEIFNNLSSNKVAGKCSHAEGGSTTASSDYSHAEGYYTTASESCSHAEGCGTTASGSFSHAEGYYTTASGKYSHAEGYHTTASGKYSHAEGYHTTASESYSHAGGYYTTASGSCSHAEGCGTIAESINQHVQGKYNAEDSNSKYAFIIGNGADSSHRSNAFAVDWDGKIYVGNSSTGVDVSDLLARIIALENKVAALENA